MRAAEVDTVHLSQLTILARHLKRRGYDLADWQRAVGGPALDETDPDARVPIATMQRAWRAALALTRSPTLGLEVGADHSFIAQSILGHLVAHSDTLGDALRGVCRYFVFLSGGMVLTLATEGEVVRLGMSTHEPDEEVWPSVVSRVSAAVFTVAVNETGGAFELQRAEWTQPESGLRAAYEQFFRAPCVFGAAACQLVFARSMLALPLLHRNPELQSFFRERLEARTAALVAPATLRDRLRARLPELIDRGHLSAGEVAAALHVSLRSFYRTLAAEGTTFQEVLDEVRRERCFALFKGDEPLEHIAFACGFADPSGFHRAFRRWTGTSPRSYRLSQATARKV